MNQPTFETVVASQVAAFADTSAYSKLKADTLSLSDYQNLLLTIFHQTQDGPATFALAAGFLPPDRFEARSYLMHHAEEEKLHWQWVIEDLKNTNYAGPDPRTKLPRTATAAYVAYNYAIAMRFPIGRLAIAATLESIGARYGAESAARLMSQLKLQPNQVRFFEGHGDTDIGHTQDILDVLKRSELTSAEWEQMCHVAEVAGQLYRNMYAENIQ